MTLPLRHDPEVVACTVGEDEAICLQMGTMTYFGLNASAIRLWDALPGLSDDKALAQWVSQAFISAPDNAVTQCEAFLATLLQHRLVQPGAGNDVAPNERAPVAWVDPALKHYDVLQQAQVYMGGSSVVPGGGATGGTVPVSGL